MNRAERIEKLKGAIAILKTEFIGLDKILDDIETSLCPWYITPELIKRPQIISLWGMTGTGKTSVVHRLVKLLDLESRTLFFDCGEDTENRSVTDKIEDYLGDDDGEDMGGKGEETGKGLVFVFDEFQYARTLNESHEEVGKPGLRSVWSIIDSGIINLTSNGWDTGTYTTFLEDLTGFVKFNPGIEVDECNVMGREDVKRILEDLGLLYFDRGVPGFMRPRKGTYTNSSVSEKDWTEDDNPYKPLRVVGDDIIRILRKKLVSKKGPQYFKEVLKSMKEATTLDEIVEILKEQRPYVVAPKYIDCSDSLVFILGNMDEAFRDSKELNPDVDADVFLESTKRVSVGDIKEALKERFRPEQIARFGNNIIKYPSLSRENFKEVIRQETERICTKFEKEFGISVTVEEDMENLLYSEGVYPVQGVRPVFTTIGTILTPILSKILIYLENKEGKETYNVRIGLHGETDFKKPNIRAFIDYSDTLRESITVNLPLGEERNPEKRKTRVICSVHEAGHAIVMAYLTGEVPRQIISVSTDHGGFCITADKERDGEIKTRLDIMNHICIGLAGYEAERLVYGERQEMLLCGTSEDITTCWDEFSTEAYKGGYFGDPYSYSYRDAEQSNNGEICGFDDHEVAQKMKTEFERLREKTKEILSSNRLLLKKMAESLAVTGGMCKEEMMKLINTNAGTLTEARLEEAKHENDYSWYLGKL
jgi:hypothetical protein